eukprot:Hpha_TRINITY_DN15287_c1_g15::TRINITY_DN15287_c1_g15_i2::g.68021::m.68021
MGLKFALLGSFILVATAAAAVSLSGYRVSPLRESRRQGDQERASSAIGSAGGSVGASGGSTAGRGGEGGADGARGRTEDGSVSGTGAGDDSRVQRNGERKRLRRDHGRDCKVFVYNLSHTQPGMSFAEDFEPGEKAGFEYPEMRHKFTEVLGCQECGSWETTHPYELRTCCEKKWKRRKDKRKKEPLDWVIPNHHMQQPRVVHRRLLLHPARTTSPKDADLFFIPVSSEHLGTGPRPATVIPLLEKALRAQNPNLDRTSHRHFLTPGRTADMYAAVPTSQKYQEAPWFRDAALFVSETFPGNPPNWYPLPYFSFSGAWEPGKKNGVEMGRGKKRRKWLVCASFQDRIAEFVVGGQQRRWIARMCLERPQLCKTWIGQGQGEQSPEEVLKMYRQ